MATQEEKVKKLTDTVQVIKHGSKDHFAMLEAGYEMTVDEAKQIIAEREKDPHTHPYDVYKKAKALLEASKAKPVPVSNRKHFTRSKGG